MLLDEYLKNRPMLLDAYLQKHASVHLERAMSGGRFPNCGQVGKRALKGARRTATPFITAAGMAATTLANTKDARPFAIPAIISDNLSHLNPMRRKMKPPWVIQDSPVATGGPS